MSGSRKTVGAAIIPATAPSAAAKPQPSASIQPTRTHQPAGIGIEGDRPHREPQRREPEEKPEHGDGAETDAKRADVLDRDRHPADDHGAVGERTVERLDLGSP